ncbi:MAG: DMT family transporter, partial [Bacteroidales bacterium]|nr:DMT family transporter [Candidatus Colimorpha onthohippi]
AIEPNLSVTTLVTFRLLLASLNMVPALLLLRRWEPIKKGDLKWFLLLSLTEPFLYSLCETGGVQYVSASLTSVIIAMVPVFVPFTMALAYHERIKTSVVCGAVLSVIGVATMMLGDFSLDASWAGIALLGGAIVVSQFYVLLIVKVVHRYRAVMVTTYQNLFGLLYFIPLTLLTDFHQLPLLSYSPKMIVLILALGLLCSTLAYVFYNYGIRYLGASITSTFINGSAVVTLVAAVVSGQEPFSWVKVLGVAVAIVGVFVAQHDFEKSLD